LEALPETLRSVVILRGLRGYSTAQTAAELGITENTVKVRLHRGRQQLQQFLEGM
jgi:RNA polymerase sigma-70 factor (ECF subfamily)